MEEISPLFAIQAEKALKMNNPQLAVEICKRGLQFFPDYQIGYVLMAEAYEMMGETSERDNLVEQIHQKFPKAITTKVIDEKMKADGTLLLNNQEPTNIESNVANVVEISDDLDKWTMVEAELINDENNSVSVQEELANIDELIDEAQSVIEDLEETIEDLDDEIANVAGEYVEQMIDTDENDDTNDELIQEYAELESKIADLQDFSNSNDDPESVVDFSEDLLELEKQHIPFESEINSFQVIDIHNVNFADINLIAGINFLPFEFNFSDIFELSKNISLENYLNIESVEHKADEIDEEITFSMVDDEKQNQDFYKTEPIEDAEYEQESTEKHFPEDFVPTETLAMIYEKQGKYMNAIDIYQKLMEIHPDKMEHYLNKIMLLETDGN